MVHGGEKAYRSLSATLAIVHYLVYHRCPLGETDGNHRVTWLDQMESDEQGFIKPVKITFEGEKRVK